MRRSIGRTSALTGAFVAATTLVVASAGVAAAADSSTATPAATATSTASPTTAPTTTGTPSPSSTTPAPSSPWTSPTTPLACPDPAFGPTGVTATARLTGTASNSVQATITWPPLTQPAGCSRGTVEIMQVSPAGPTTSVPDTGQAVITGLTTLTAYTWQIRYVSGTVSTWTTVSVPAVLPLDYCLGLPGPRPIVATTPSPSSVHLEWGTISYPSQCSGSLTVRNVTAGTPAITVDRTRTGVTIEGLTPGSTSTWLVTFMIQLGTVTVTQPSASGRTCTATAHLDSVWGDGFVATVTVRNTSAATSTAGWSVGWTPPSGVRVDNTWMALPSTSGGRFTATNASWNGTLAPGATTLFGFLAHTSGGAPATPTLTCTPS